VNSGGSYTGGFIKEDAMVLARKHELDTLKTKLTEITDTLELQKNSRNVLFEQVAKADAELDHFRGEVSALTTEETKLTTEIAGKNNLVKQFEEQLKKGNEKLSARDATLAETSADIAAREKIFADIEAQITELSEKAALVSEKLSALIIARKRKSEELAELNLSVLRAEKDIDISESELASLRREKGNNAAESENSKDEIDKLTADNTRLETERADAIAKTREMEMGVSKFRARTTAIIEKQNAAEMKTSELNREIKDKTAEREKFASILAAAKEREKNYSDTIDKIKSELWRKYEITFNEAKESTSALITELQSDYELENAPDIVKINSLLSDVRKELAALGNVNFSAVQEYEELKVQFDIMTTQLTDAKGAKEKLEQLIAELTETIKTTFLANFNAINEHFGRIFTEVFGGGKARLELTDPEDVLGSNIDIFAAPPGKVIKNLISLSGGEQTMTAVSIYLAILNHRPTPFCMLDEVDAALDEANVITYATYLKKFAQNTQLMTITHRRGTMERCDVLYGVYMKEKGVSQLLRRELTDEEFG
jgi:chromosome segregation protein